MEAATVPCLVRRLHHLGQHQDHRLLVVAIAGRVVERNFRDYQMVHIADAPLVTTAFIRSDAPLGGLGEPAVPPVAPAVANAWASLPTGKRAYSLPFFPGATMGGL